jgi:multidrug efflux pump subunit AcrA (membrane-fusion protein)
MRKKQKTMETLETPTQFTDLDQAQSALDAAQKRQDELLAKYREEMAAIEAEKARLSEIRRPCGLKIDKRNELLARIEMATRQREYEQAQAEHFTHLIDGLVGNGMIAEIGNFMRADSFAHLAIAERAAREIDAWLERKRAEVQQLESEIVEYAKEHNLTTWVANYGFQI